VDEEMIDDLARELYHVRSMSAREMTDERWETVKSRFPSSYRVVREEAITMIENGEFA
jgi:hypothetical protein